MNGRSNPGLPPWAIFDRPLRGLNVLKNLSPADNTIEKLDDWPRPLPSPKDEGVTDPLWETLNGFAVHLAGRRYSGSRPRRRASSSAGGRGGSQ